MRATLVRILRTDRRLGALPGLSVCRVLELTMSLLLAWGLWRAVLGWPVLPIFAAVGCLAGLWFVVAGLAVVPPAPGALVVRRPMRRSPRKGRRARPPHHAPRLSFDHRRLLREEVGRRHRSRRG